MRNPSVVAIDLFAALMTFLRLQRQRGDRTRVQPLDADRLAGLLAIAVGAFVDALKRKIDLVDKFSLTVSRPLLRLISWVRSTCEPQTGHCSGTGTGCAVAGRRSSTTWTTWGKRFTRNV